MTFSTTSFGIQGADVFKGCTSLTTVTIPTVSAWSTGFFSGSTSLATIIMTGTTTTVGATNFQGLIALASVTFPTGMITAIGSGSFQSTSASSTPLTIMGYVPPSLFAFASSLFVPSSVIIGSTVANIGANAFSGAFSYSFSGTLHKT